MIDQIDVHDTLTLDDNKKYLVVGKALYNNVNYLSLINTDEYIVKFVAVTGNQLIVLDNKKDKVLIEELIPLFVDSVSKIYADLFKNSDI